MWVFPSPSQVVLWTRSRMFELSIRPCCITALTAHIPLSNILNIFFLDRMTSCLRTVGQLSFQCWNLGRMPMALQVMWPQWSLAVMWPHSSVSGPRPAALSPELCKRVRATTLPGGGFSSPGSCSCFALELLTHFHLFLLCLNSEKCLPASPPSFLWYVRLMV